jgi:hypothetical protein
MKKTSSMIAALLALGGIGTTAPTAATPNVVTQAPVNTAPSDAQNPQASAAPIVGQRAPDAPKYFPARGWVYVGVKALPVTVLAVVGSNYRVRFLTRKRGLRGHVGPVPMTAVSFNPPQGRV